MGQADIFQGGPDAGGLQQYTILEERFSCKVPSDWANEEASTLPSNLSAAAIAFFSSSGSPLNVMNEAGGLGLPPPWTKEAATFGFPQKTILIIGAGAATGKFGVQLAKILGFGTIIAVAGPRNATELQKIGATHIIDRHAPNVVQKIRAIAEGNILYAYDTSNFDHSLALDVVSKDNGHVACLAATPPHGIPDSEKPHAKFVMGVSHLQPDLMSEFWERLPSYMRSRGIVPSAYKIIEGLDADAINAACDTILTGEEQIKVQVLHTAM
ncbi:hypothetical protein NQ176_g1095 [Zarea fungicola]|uniref:Uncharacterized protein n=1 Tax=Zarea fungicola TaxID=93591 RepID=A0ACC1NVJ9_9HYPO|nr:hypothetical protein NQ176_g1095 [Lecanicillium fungicola]